MKNIGIVIKKKLLIKLYIILIYNLMTAGSLILVANSIYDIFLIKNPQITLFKMLYKRHTNFAIETISQQFSNKPQLGKSSTLVLNVSADLIYNMSLIITLPKINKFILNDTDDYITKFAWIKNIGYGIIKSISVDIDGQEIKYTGELLYLLNKIDGLNQNNIDNLIGNIKDLTDYSNGKNEYTLMIPLKFWFCNNIESALPICAINSNVVKINLELNEVNNVYLINPSHYIYIKNDIVNFTKDEYLIQTINNKTIAEGKFVYYDILTNKLYYHKISENNFVSISADKKLSQQYYNTNYYENSNYFNYYIYGKQSNFYVMPLINSLATKHIYSDLNDLNPINCYLSIDIIYLDSEERKSILTKPQEYLIEQPIIINNKLIEGNNKTIDVNLNNSVKYIIWFAQNNYLINSYNNDLFNYTDNYDSSIGKNLITNESILINDNELYSFRSSDYYNLIQPFIYLRTYLQPGLNFCSFCLNPNELNPSGNINMSKFNVKLKLQLSHSINLFNTVNLRGYAMSYNVLKIAYGYASFLYS